MNDCMSYEVDIKHKKKKHDRKKEKMNSYCIKEVKYEKIVITFESNKEDEEVLGTTTTTTTILN